MKRIFSLIDIKSHIPQEETVLIRILDTDINKKNIKNNLDLEFRDKYKKIYQFFFDDVDLTQFKNKNEFLEYCNTYGLKPISNKDVNNLLKIGSLLKIEETLIVHCKVGISRSPAVLGALNYIYKLNLNNRNVLNDYTNYNRYINKKIIETYNKEKK